MTNLTTTKKTIVRQIGRWAVWLYLASGLAALGQAPLQVVPVVRSASELAKDTGTPESRRILADLQKRFPNTQFERVTPAPMAGLFEVVMGRNVAYVDGTAKYFLFGHIFDMESRVDLTQLSLGQEPVKTVAWDALPLSDAIVFGKGAKKLAVFSDPECPYCKRIENELSQLNDVTVYVFPYPIAQLHPAAAGIAQAIWCAPDRSQAWRTYLTTADLPPAASGKDCQHPIDRNVALAERLGIHATPTLIAEDGRMVSGGSSAQDIRNWLQGEKP
jgi:thiol:disulfide interchange protein DsbC